MSNAHMPVSIDQAWDFHRCANRRALVTSEKILGFVRAAGFSVRRHAYEKFEPGPGMTEGGYTLVVVIGESSVDIHTWPEGGTVHLTIHHCNYTEDNSLKATELFRLLCGHFQPGTTIMHGTRRRPVFDPAEVRQAAAT